MHVELVPPTVAMTKPAVASHFPSSSWNLLSDQQSGFKVDEAHAVLEQQAEDELNRVNKSQ